MSRLRGKLAAVRRARERGYTLIEILIVIMILSSVLAMAQGALILTSRTVGNTATRLDQGQQAKTAEESMSQVLRTAILPKQLSGTCSGCDVAAFISGDASSVHFYANINNDLAMPSSGPTTFGPSQVGYVLTSDGTLTETVQPPNVHDVTDFNFQYCTPGPGCTVRTRILARNVVTTGSLFTYYDHNGAQLAVPLQSSVNRLQSVDSVDILLTVKTTSGVEGTTLTTRVMLPNADSVYQTQTASAT